MAGELVYVPNYMPARDRNGLPYAGALMHFYVDGTTTHIAGAPYTNIGLTTAHTNPVVADAAGVFPAIYMDDGDAFTVSITRSDGAPLKTYTGVTTSVAYGTVNNGDWSGADLAIVNGGTGASTAAGARSNLGAAADADVIKIAGGGTTLSPQTNMIVAWNNAGVLTHLDVNPDDLGTHEARLDLVEAINADPRLDALEAATAEVAGALFPTGATAQARFQAAHDALPATGGRIVVPGGEYTFTGGVTITKPDVTFELGAATLIAGVGTGDIFTVNAERTRLLNYYFKASVPRTAGAYVKATGGRGHVYEGYMEDQFVGVNLDGVVGARIRGVLTDTAAAGWAIQLGNTTYTGATDIDVLADAAVDQAAGAVRIRYADVVNLKGTYVRHGVNVLVDPQNGQTASLVTLAAPMLDTSTQGLVTRPAAGGTVVRLRMAGGWAGVHSGAAAIEIDGTAGATDDIEIESVWAKGNTSRGVYARGTVTDLKLKSVQATNNATGVDIGASVSGYAEGTDTTGNSGTGFANASATFRASDAQPADWIAYTPSVAATAGTITTSSAIGRWRREGNTVHFRATVTITTNGTGTGGINVGLPVAAVAGAERSVAYGGEFATSGEAVWGLIDGSASVAFVRKASNAYPAVSGSIFTIAGTYEAA